MVDQIQQEFVRSFIIFLRGPSVLQHLPPDCKESVDVAVQCLQTAFDIEERELDIHIPETKNENNHPRTSSIDIFEVFQSLFIEQSPKKTQMAETYKNEGNRLMKDGKYNEALLLYNRAITFDPKNPIYYCNRAAAYIRLNNNESAVTDCKTALLYKPTYSKAYGRLGIAYSNLKKYTEAQKAYEKAIELDPENQDYRNNLEVACEAAQVRNSFPQITEGINNMMSTPVLQNFFNSADIDLEQLQIMSQNPIVMNAVSELISGLPAQSGGGNDPSRLPSRLVQLFQSLANQLSAQSDGDTNERPNPGSETHNSPQ